MRSMNVGDLVSRGREGYRRREGQGDVNMGRQELNTNIDHALEINEVDANQRGA